jgi:hypothetical protein
MTPKDFHEILPFEVGRDRAALRIQGTPACAPLQLVKGHWDALSAPTSRAGSLAARQAGGQTRTIPLPLA